MPANSTQDEQPNSRSEGSNAADRQLSFIGRFIDKYYLRQSKSVQTATFIVFVLLFAYGFLNILNGKYVLKGNLYKATASGGLTYAPYYGVRWGTDDFASNSRGEYYVALGFGEYLRALISGGHEVIFLQPDPSGMNEQVAWSGNVTVNRVDGEFENVKISYSTPPATPKPTGPGATNRMHTAPESLLFPFAWASETAGPGVYQLVVHSVRLSSGAAQGKVTIELMANKQTLELRDRSMSDLAAGPLPLLAGQNIDLGSNLYFAIPGNSLPVRGQVHVTAPASGFFQFSNYQEEFPLPADQSVGQALQLRGSRGGAVTARVLFSQPVKLYREADWAAKKGALEAAFLNQGFVVQWADPPLGALAATNAIWTGPMVPFEVVQRLLKAAVDQQIALKKIQYRYQFQTTSNPTEMQIGSSRACVNFEPIPSQALQQAIDASSEEAFQRVIAPFTCSATSGVRTPARRRPR